MTKWWQLLVNLINLVECKSLTTFYFIILITVEDRPPAFVFTHALIDPLLNKPEYTKMVLRPLPTSIHFLHKADYLINTLHNCITADWLNWTVPSNGAFSLYLIVTFYVVVIFRICCEREVRASIDLKIEWGNLSCKNRDLKIEVWSFYCKRQTAVCG